MKRKLLIVLLSLGTLAGFGAGCASCHCRRHAFERHVQRICTEAARSVCPPRTGAPAPPPASAPQR